MSDQVGLDHPLELGTRVVTLAGETTRDPDRGSYDAPVNSVGYVVSLLSRSGKSPWCYDVLFPESGVRVVLDQDHIDDPAKYTVITGFRETGPELLRQAVNRILERPKTWYQGEWHYDTVHCVAGHCEIIALGLFDSLFAKDRWDAETVGTGRVARKALGLDPEQASWLFSSERRFKGIYEFAKGFLAGKRLHARDRADITMEEHSSPYVDGDLSQFPLLEPRDSRTQTEANGGHQ